MVKSDATPPAVLLREVTTGEFGEGTRASDTTLDLRARKLTGRRLDLKVKGKPIRQDYYAFQAGARSFVLMIQDALTKDGKPTEATRGVVELLKQTLTFK